MRLKNALTLISEEEIEKKITPSDFIIEPDLNSLRIGNASGIFEEALFIEMKELFKVYLYKYKYRGMVAASTNQEGPLLNEEDTLKSFALRKKDLAKRKITKLLDFFIKEKKQQLNEAREELLVVLRTITFSDFCDKNNIFHDEDIVVFIKQSSVKLSYDVEKISITVVRSLRGSLVNKTGTSIEKVIQKILKEKDWGVIEGLKKYGELTVDFKKSNKSGETVTPNIVLSRINSAPYDLTVKFPYSKEFLFGIHIKLLANPTVVSSMGNNVLKFGKTEWAASREFVENCTKKYNLVNNNETTFFIEPISIKEKNKENKGAEVHVLSFITALLQKLGNSTKDKEIIKGIATLCRIQKERSMWIIVYPQNAEVSWSPSISSIIKDKDKIVFIGEGGKPVFTTDSKGKTRAILGRG